MDYLTWELALASHIFVIISMFTSHAILKCYVVHEVWWKKNQRTFNFWQTNIHNGVTNGNQHLWMQSYRTSRRGSKQHGDATTYTPWSHSCHGYLTALGPSIHTSFHSIYQCTPLVHELVLLLQSCLSQWTWIVKTVVGCANFTIKFNFKNSQVGKIRIFPHSLAVFPSYSLKFSSFCSSFWSSGWVAWEGPQLCHWQRNFKPTAMQYIRFLRYHSRWKHLENSKNFSRGGALT